MSRWREPVRRARVFAARIGARHERLFARLAPLSRVFARLAPTLRIASRITERHTHVNVAPRLALSLVVVREGENVVGRGPSLASLVLRRAERVERTVITRRALVERVVARGARHEGTPAHAMSQSSAIAPPAPRVLRRPTHTPAPVREERAPQPRTRVPEPASRAALSAFEVNQLTETVIRSIDRRLSAARERRGRS